ncbi:MAG: GntR family transcriptional regulator [Gammaproteobacteria bacterium]|jgi:DNA-binding LacI/PurR family transcriptional regulator
MDKVTPKYVLVQNKIKDAIKHRKIIDRLPGERTLAKEYEVSYMTIRKAVDNLVTEGLLYKIPMKGTFVADRKTRKKKTNIIGYFLDSSIVAGLTSPYYSLIFNALQRQATTHGYSLIYFSDIGDSRSYKHIHNMDGAIISCFPRIEHIVDEINQNIPVVVIDNSSSDKTIPSVIIDNFNAVRASVNHLCSRGHKRIGFITGLQDSDVGNNRFAGYKSGLSDNGLKLSEKLIFRGDYSFESGTKGADYFLSLKNPPTAIMCANDAMAIALIRQAAQRGVNVPNDISVIGFDDIAVASQISPALTTLAAPIDKITEQACNMLVSLINGEKLENRHIALPAELVIRDSCADVKDTVAA